MPDIRFSREGHILPSSSHSHSHSHSSSAHYDSLNPSSSHHLPPSRASGYHNRHGSIGSSSVSVSRGASPAPVPPLPQSQSLAGHLAAYAAGEGYGHQASSSSSAAGAGAGGGPQTGFGSPIRLGEIQKRRSYASLRAASSSTGVGEDLPRLSSFSSNTIASFPSSGGGGGSGKREIPSVMGVFQQQGIAGKAEAVRMPKGPGMPAPSPATDEGATAAAAVGTGSEGEWRRRG